MRIQSFRFQEQLMRVLVRELDELILNRRTVTWPDSLNLPAIERRPRNTVENHAASLRRCPRNEALNLRTLDPLRHKGERRGLFITLLRSEFGPVDCPS